MDLITERETIFGTKIFNKTYILSQDINKINDLIIENEICQIDWSLFSNMGFNIIFKHNRICLFYKDNLIDKQNIDFVIGEFKEHFPPNPMIYKITLNKIILGLMEGNLTIPHYCINIPEPYLKLWTLRVNSLFPSSKEIYSSDEYRKLEWIMGGYQQKQEVSNKSESKKKGPEQNKNDETHRMEVLSYLEDSEIDTFLTNCLDLDKLFSSIVDDQRVVYDVIKLLLIMTNTKNIIARIYFVNQMFNIINNYPDILQNSGFKQVVSIKCEEIQEILFTYGDSGLDLIDETIKTLQTTNLLLQQN